MKPMYLRYLTVCHSQHLNINITNVDISEKYPKTLELCLQKDKVSLSVNSVDMRLNGEVYTAHEIWATSP